jgi:hypothetical protein
MAIIIALAITAAIISIMNICEKVEDQKHSNQH